MWMDSVHCKSRSACHCQDVSLCMCVVCVLYIAVTLSSALCLVLLAGAVCLLYFLLTLFSAHCIVKMSSFANTTVKMCRLSTGTVCVCCTFFCLFSAHCIVKMCRLSAIQLSRCVILGRGCVLNILLTFFSPLYCQDVLSFGNTTVKMRCLSAGAVCVLYIYLTLLSAHCIVKMCRLSAGLCVFVCVVHSLILYCKMAVMNRQLEN